MAQSFKPHGLQKQRERARSVQAKGMSFKGSPQVNYFLVLCPDFYKISPLRSRVGDPIDGSRTLHGSFYQYSHHLGSRPSACMHIQNIHRLCSHRSKVWPQRIRSGRGLKRRMRIDGL